jgi:hypothetical protein
MGFLMENINIRRIDILINSDHREIEGIYSRNPEETLIKDRLWNKVLQRNLKEKIKYSLSVLYFFSLVYFTIQLFI